MTSRSAYLSKETIAAISTETGGAISIVRVSGPRAFETLEQLTASNPGTRTESPKNSESRNSESRNSEPRNSEPRKMMRSHLFLPEGGVLDDALYVRFVAPHSYTGEDMVEYHLHGGRFIAHRLMETLEFHGIRQALPGEFSFRSVRNGKMTLSQAQAVADLIASSNDGAIALALEKMSGTQSRLLENLASQLRKMAVLGEVGIDFADQDVEEVSLPYLKNELYPILQILEKLQLSYARGFRLQEGIQVAFAGLPNAGKSSFFNALLGEDRSIVSDMAGTTRDIVREKLTLRGKKSTVTLRLEDTAGLRATDHPVEKIGIERTHQSIQKAELILFLVDPTSSIEEVTSLSSILIGDKTIGILTKSDLLNPAELEKSLKQFKTLVGISKWVSTSALTGAGIEEAIDVIVEFCEKWIHREPGEVLLTRLDHLSAVQKALTHLGRAQQASEIDLFASDIRQALHSLGPLIGETLPDDILGQIFSHFCIGK